MHGSESDFEDALEAARINPRLARSLARVANPAARRALERLALESQDGRIAVNAMASLALIANAASWELFTGQVRDPKHGSHEATASFFEAHGTPEAIEQLHDMAELGGPARSAAAQSLLRLGHPEFAPVVISDALHNVRAERCLIDAGEGPWARELVAELERYADVEERTTEEVARLRDRAERGREKFGAESLNVPKELRGPEIEMDELRASAKRIIETRVWKLSALVRSADRVNGEAIVASVGERSGLPVRIGPIQWELPQKPVVPDGMKTTTAQALDWQPGDPNSTSTRLGGQPTWRRDPTWPLARDGRPMTFWGQFDIPDLPGKLALLFVDIDDELHDADAGGSALIVEGGPTPASFERRSTGPSMPLKMRATRNSRTYIRTAQPYLATLERFEEPLSWADVEPGKWSTNKVGGSPRFLQGAPSEEHRRSFVFEFDAEEAGHELADGARCYGFVDRESLEGSFYWDCH